MSELVILLKKPIKFENEDHSTIDLSGLEDLSGIDILNAQRLFKKLNPDVHFVASYSLETSYILILAEKVSGLPLAFFHTLPAPIFNKLVQKVQAFLNSDLEE